eukprot:CAMPEP_0205905090 /NCGR_PEP_ID=MMETSP1325-20131115/1141_1 /ASSEMBLY_ACC=CAM_ASM_000708 /TAXON_ID=236786 /ORGANISM="Florenciella sp., Strain RCC1007" /LENGTH=106 /DNA_ID=CAMNT_0053270969 /DNA_START=444 /DNA_END=762 /DNA_ORIENTATION=-
MSGSYSRDQFAAAAQVSQVRTSHSNSRPPPSLHRHVGAPICLICLVPTIDSSGDSNNFINATGVAAQLEHERWRRKARSSSHIETLAGGRLDSTSIVSSMSSASLP